MCAHVERVCLCGPHIPSRQWNRAWSSDIWRTLHTFKHINQSRRQRCTTRAISSHAWRTLCIRYWLGMGLCANVLLCKCVCVFFMLLCVCVCVWGVGVGVDSG